MPKDFRSDVEFNGAVTVVGNLTASAGTTTLGTTNTGTVTSTGSIVANIIHANANNTGQNFKVGDDVWIGDINIADTMSIRGISGASSNGYIRFGSDSNNFGYNGTNLVYGGNRITTDDRVRNHLAQSTTTLDVLDRSTLTLATNNTATASTVYWTFFTPMENFTASSITFVTGLTAATTVTTAKMGLYTFDGTTASLVARTANDTTLFTGTSTAYTRAFDTTGGYPSSYTLTAGTRYGIAMLVIATTQPTMAGMTTSAAVAALSPRVNGTSTGKNDLPTTSTVTATTISMFGRLS